MPAVRAVQGDCQWLLKTVEIPSGHARQHSIATEAIPTYIWTIQSQKGDSGLFIPIESPTTTDSLAV